MIESRNKAGLLEDIPGRSLAYIATTEKVEARRWFIELFGKEPAELKMVKGLWWAGPVEDGDGFD